MVRLPTNPPAPPPAAGATPSYDASFRRATPVERPEAIAMLLTGRREASDAAVRPFLDFAAEHGLDLTDLWLGFEGRRLLATALVVPGVGRTAMLFASPAVSNARAELTGRLVGHALAHVEAGRFALVQALLEPGQDLQRRALEAGGMRHLAELAYMHRRGQAVGPLPPPKLDGRPLQAVTWSEAERPRFADAIESSYESTLDCPGLLGLRDIDDVIAGHMATGRFDPRRWTVWSDPDDGRPVAVVLLNESAAARGYELVYLGVCPHARGRGLSRPLMRRALDVTADLGAYAELFLAVDDANAPALRLYGGLGFRVSHRKTALIHTPNP
ncbi:MAG: GNAT family N-acetyltransferase [Planctomycetota bacterium]